MIGGRVKATGTWTKKSRPCSSKVTLTLSSPAFLLLETLAYNIFTPTNPPMVSLLATSFPTMETTVVSAQLKLAQTMMKFCRV